MENKMSKVDCANVQLSLMGKMSAIELKIISELARIREDIAGLKVKASVWGLLGGLIPAIAGAIFVLITYYHK